MSTIGLSEYQMCIRDRSAPSCIYYRLYDLKKSVQLIVTYPNIMLNELDKEMEKRGLNFVRYADDCIIMVGSEMSANRVMRNISRFIEEKLGLKVNMTKSKVDRPSGLKYLGFGFYFDTRNRRRFSFLHSPPA